MSQYEAEQHFEELREARNRAYIESLNHSGDAVHFLKQNVINIEADMQKHAWLYNLTNPLYVVK
jgi:hypothetical protein|tara:strand:- start:958 stop:1149 length:192 start_codon:yes stop_codon:yes gene_type:complete